MTGNSKRVVLADPTLAFLRDAVERIDERDVKYHKRPTRKRKAAADGTAAPKKRAPKSKKTTAAAAAAPEPLASQTKAASPAVDIEEDDNYDESDSE